MYLKVLTKYCYEVIFEKFLIPVPYNFMLTTNTNFKSATRTIDIIRSKLFNIQVKRI